MTESHHTAWLTAGAALIAIVSTLGGWVLAVARGARSDGQQSAQLLASLDTLRIEVQRLAALQERDRLELKEEVRRLHERLSNGIAAAVADLKTRISVIEVKCEMEHERQKGHGDDHR